MPNHGKARPKGLPKTGGRTMGTKNKATSLRERIHTLLESYTLEMMIDDLHNIPPLERLRITTGLFEYVTPKLARVEQLGDGAVKQQMIILTSEEDRLKLTMLTNEPTNQDHEGIQQES